MSEGKGGLEVLLPVLDESYERQAWHGPNLKGSLRGVSAETAAWRPGPGRHNIWEIAVHAAYWKYIVRRRLLGENKGSFPLEGSNWFERPEEIDERSWMKDRRLLEQMHRSLRQAIAEMPPALLWRTPPGSKVSNIRQIYGIAMHDVYHAGQIQMIKRLARKR
jgi:uncharacterized damage-inducible protein DinB